MNYLHYIIAVAAALALFMLIGVNDELAKEYEARSLEPADLYSVARWDEANKEREDKECLATHWTDAQGKWCYASVLRWHGERVVYVNRSDDDWGDDWGDGCWFAGVLVRKPSKSAAKNSDALPSQLIINGITYKRV